LNDKDQDGYCDKCPKPKLFVNNVDHIRLAASSMTQLRSGPVGIFGFDYVAVSLVAEKLGVDFDLDAVQAMESVLLESMRNGEKR